MGILRKTQKASNLGKNDINWHLLWVSHGARRLYIYLCHFPNLMIWILFVKYNEEVIKLEIFYIAN